MQLAISTTDLVIVLAYIFATLILGLWIGSGKQNLSGYLVGGRSMPWYAILGSIIATETSAVTFLSVPGYSFPDQGNSSFLQLPMGFMVGRLLVIFWLLPGYFKGEVFTAYDILHKRFGSLTQRVASLVFMLTRTIADGLRLYLTGLVLAKVTNVDIALCVAAIAIATVAYSSFGGIKSVVWNDCIQLVVYLIGAVAALWVISDSLPGGVAEMARFGTETGRLEWFMWSPRLSDSNWWTGLVGGVFLSLATHGTDQLMVQRYLCARSQKSAGLALGLSGPLVFLQFALFLFVGAALAAFYRYHTLVDGTPADQVFASFIVDYMPVGLCGLTLAAVFSVAMSTLSSSLSSSASAVVNDFIKPAAKRKISLQGHFDSAAEERLDKHLTSVSRIASAIFGGLQMAVAIFVANTPSLAQSSVVGMVITVAGFASGVVLGVFFLGMLSRQFHERSIMLGMLAGLLFTAILVFAPVESWWKVHGWWAAVVASLSTVFVALAIDLLFPAQSRMIESDAL